jgi:hypothetical protein
MKAPLAKNHTGMKISARGILMRVRGELKGSATELLDNLSEMSTRYYAGDIAVVDEFLQLYGLDYDRPKNETGVTEPEE